MNCGICSCGVKKAVHTVMGDESIVEGLSDNNGCIGIIFVRNLILRCASGALTGLQ